MSAKMTKYKPADFVDDETSSMGSVQINDSLNASSPGSVHVRFQNPSLNHTTSHLHYSSNMAYLQQMSFKKFWRSRNVLERCLLILILFLFTLVIILSILLSVQGHHHHPNEANQIIVPSAGDRSSVFPIKPETTTPRAKNQNANEKYCLLEPCIHAASDILDSIDFSVDPCEDFYEFSCNKWIKKNPIPDGKSMWGTFGKLEQQNQLVIKNVLEKSIEEFKSKSEKKAKLYYESCLDSDDLIEKRGAEPLKDLLIAVGGWNVTKNDTNFNITNWTLQSTLQTLQNRYNMGGLLTWAVGEDDRNSTKHTIIIDQGGLTLPTPDDYLNKTLHEKVLTAYLDYMVKVAVLLGAKEEDAKIQMAAIVELETKLAKITIPADKRRDDESLYHSMTMVQLQELAPFINWRDLFEDAFRIVKRKISDKETVVVYAPEYLQNLNRILKEEYLNSDDGKIVLNNYLVWQLVRSFTACLSKNFRDAYKGLRKALMGSDGGEEPWRYCVSDTNNVIGFAVGAMFVREVFHGKSKPDAENMINNVREAFKENFNNLEWMDKETRALAEDKANAISDMIGFPDYILNPDLLDEKYRDLDVDPKKYFENNVKANIFNLKKNLENLDKPVNKTKWGMTPSTVNAYYTPTKNQIVFPAGILQLPFYDLRYPKSLNYGAMGVVMGHELTHAFDDQGREYDKNGNLNRWWNNETITKFKDRTNCITDQYNKYKINGKGLNGKQTLGENIADNGGLKAAYHAYLKVMQNSTDSIDFLPLPGVNLTHTQLFFISFAQVWCSAVTEETVNLQMEKDTHSPPRFRVIGTLSNLHEFSDDFKCALDSPMNPIKKCEVW